MFNDLCKIIKWPPMTKKGNIKKINTDDNHWLFQWQLYRQGLPVHQLVYCPMPLQTVTIGIIYTSKPSIESIEIIYRIYC